MNTVSRAGLLLISAALLLDGSASAAEPGYVVRLAVANGRTQVRVQAPGLTIRDGDLRDPLVKVDQELCIKPGREGLLVAGSKVTPRSVLLSAGGAIRVDGRALIGQVEVILLADGLTVVNRLPLERYLTGLLGAEMSADWPIEALKAQAVAARTFFLHRRLRREDQPWDLSASTLDQVYRGIARESASTRRAVDETRGEVLTWANEPAETLFHACCGGRTRAAQEVFSGRVAYLVAVEDPDCQACPKYRWRAALELDAVARALAGLGVSGPIRQLKDAADGIELVGARGQRWKVTKRRLRSAIGELEVPSSRFEARIESGKLVLVGQGSGHGVGMCQWGARGMALRGHDHQAILQRYYPGLKPRKLY